MSFFDFRFVQIFFDALIIIVVFVEYLKYYNT